MVYRCILFSTGQALHSDLFLSLFLCALFSILELRNRQRKLLTTRYRSSLKQPKNVTEVSKSFNLAEYSS